MATKTYEVIRENGEVFGHRKGEQFTATLTPGQERALLKSSCLAIVVEPKTAPKKPAPKDESVPSDAQPDEGK